MTDLVFSPVLSYKLIKSRSQFLDQLVVFLVVKKYAEIKQKASSAAIQIADMKMARKKYLEIKASVISTLLNKALN